MIRHLRLVEPTPYVVLSGRCVHAHGCTVLPYTNQRALTKAQAETWLAERADRRPCKICRPADLSTAARPRRAPSTQRRRSGLGWPEPAGLSWQAKVEPGGCR